MSVSVMCFQDIRKQKSLTTEFITQYQKTNIRQQKSEINRKETKGNKNIKSKTEYRKQTWEKRN